MLGVHADGGMCEYVNVPEGQLYPAGDLTLDQAAMVEFLAIGADLEFNALKDVVREMNDAIAACTSLSK